MRSADRGDRQWACDGGCRRRPHHGGDRQGVRDGSGIGKILLLDRHRLERDAPQHIVGHDENRLRGAEAIDDGRRQQLEQPGAAGTPRFDGRERLAVERSADRLRQFLALDLDDVRGDRRGARARSGAARGDDQHGMLVDDELDQRAIGRIEQPRQVVGGGRGTEAPPDAQFRQPRIQRLAPGIASRGGLLDLAVQPLDRRLVRLRQVLLPVALDDQRHQPGRETSFLITVRVGHSARDVALARCERNAERVGAQLLGGQKRADGISGFRLQHGDGREGCRRVMRHGLVGPIERGCRHSLYGQHGRSRGAQCLDGTFELAFGARLRHERAPQQIVAGERRAGAARIDGLLERLRVLLFSRIRFGEADPRPRGGILHVQVVERDEAPAVPRDGVVESFLRGEREGE